MDMLEILEEVDINLKGDIVYIKNNNKRCAIKLVNNGVDEVFIIDNTLFDVVINKTDEGLNLIVKELVDKHINSIYFQEGMKLNLYVTGEEARNELCTYLESYLLKDEIKSLAISIIKIFKANDLKIKKEFLDFLRDIAKDQIISEFEKEKILEFINGIKSIV